MVRATTRARATGRDRTRDARGGGIAGDLVDARVGGYASERREWGRVGIVDGNGFDRTRRSGGGTGDGAMRGGGDDVGGRW